MAFRNFKLSEKVNLSISLEEKLIGDLNKDGKVTIADLAIASKYYNQEKAEYDMNGDGIVGKYELDTITEKIFNN